MEGTITQRAPKLLIWGAELRDLLLRGARRTGIEAHAPRSASKATAAPICMNQFAPAVAAILGSGWQQRLPERSCSYRMGVQRATQQAVKLKIDCFARTWQLEFAFLINP